MSGLLSSPTSALIVHQRYNATLSYETTSRVLQIIVGSDVGEKRVLVSVPIASIINVESRQERLEREQSLPTAKAEKNVPGGEGDGEPGCFSFTRPSSSPKTAAVGASEPQAASRAPDLYFLHFIPAKAKKGSDLRSLSFSTRNGSEENVANLVKAINADIYRTGCKTIIGFISPVSGSGKAQIMWNETVYAVLRFSRHKIVPIVTTHRFHCEEYIADLRNELTDEHVVVAVGGDGMMHEAVNGLDQRRRALAAAGIAGRSEPLLATVPAGSGCAMAKAFCILEPLQAAVAMVHLEAVTIDLMRITFIDTYRVEPLTKEEKKAKVEPKRTLLDASAIPPRVSFLNVAMGLTCEIDRGSEKWRWMGNARFTVYAGQLVVQGLRPYKIHVRYVPWKSRSGGAEVSKMTAGEKFPESFQFCTHRDDCAQCQTHQQEKLENAEQPIVDSDWIAVPEDAHVMAMANNFQDAARDMAIAPYAHVGDGSIDLVMAGSMASSAIKPISRTQFIGIFLGLEEGKHIHNDMVTYAKCRAIEFLPEEGMVMSDGEVIATAGVRVTMLPNGARVIRSR